MGEPLLALGLLAAASAVVWAFLAWRHTRLTQAGAADVMAAHGAAKNGALVLAFTTPDCVPCKTIQRPALDELRRLHPGRVAVSEVDALAAPEVARRFGILTVPSTVVIGPGGRIRAINHGTATAQRLAAQTGLSSALRDNTC